MSKQQHQGQQKRRKHSRGFRPSKRLGQNFLRDPAILQTIVASSDIDRDTLVLEIGPGEGALTEQLAEAAGHLVAVELDERLIPILRTRFALQDAVEIYQGNILHMDIERLVRETLCRTGLSQLRVVGNLPYYITTAIIRRLLEADIPARSLTVMVQREVGERLLAAPGGRAIGAMTYLVRYRSEPHWICDVPRTAFFPVPRVDSQVLRLDLLPEPPVHVADEALFFRCIRAGFLQRRKTLRNALTSLDGYTPEQIRRALAQADIAAERRAETLTMQEFARLANTLQEV